MTAQLQGRKVTTSTGPRPSEFPLFKPDNQAAEFKAGAGFLRVIDPGEKSVLDFTAGDSITLEAWVSPNSTQAGKYSYIIGKGRTNRKGVARDNQNYGLRLAGSDISFLFRGQPVKKDAKPDYHRWTSKGAGISAYNWHHIAVTYTFGKKKSLKAYVDGRAISGKWDMGGDTTIAPVVDNDEVWLGSSMGGSANSSFDGRMDAVAIYRTALSAKQVTAHFKYVAPKPRIDWTAVPSDRVQVDVFEGVPNRKSWTFRPPRFSESITQPHFALIQIPYKYSNQGLRIDRSGPFLIRALSHVTIPKGKKRILVRARNASRLYIDEKLVAQTGFHKISGSAHGKVFDVDRTLAPNIRPLHRGDQEKVFEFTGDGKPHRVRFEMFVGGFGHRPDLGETAIFIGDPGKDFQLLSSNDEVVWLTDESWLAFERKFRHAQIAINAQRRQNSTTKEDKYWEWRHQLAKQEILKQP
ncbi:MAG: LamG domain-containing protein, partial [Gimesia sp.]|nr:LamG domain-containing protein [Gimesia sp.]